MLVDTQNMKEYANTTMISSGGLKHCRLPLSILYSYEVLSYMYYM